MGLDQPFELFDTVTDSKSVVIDRFGDESFQSMGEFWLSFSGDE